MAGWSVGPPERLGDGRSGPPDKKMAATRQAWVGGLTIKSGLDPLLDYGTPQAKK